MADKTELVEKINGLLGVKLESLDRMTKEDLEKMIKALEDPAGLFVKASSTRLQTLRGQARAEFRNRLKELTEGFGEDRGGLIGLGIIPINLDEILPLRRRPAPSEEKTEETGG